MFRVETIYTPGLAQYGYVLISEGEAAAFDPRRDTGAMQEALGGAKLRYIFETHSHADFVTGGPQLASETGATLYISDKVNPAVPHEPLRDQQTFTLSSAKITALHTPGHTPEHMAYFVEDLEQKQPPALFSGDVMFVGDLGRPELLGQDLATELAPQLFDSVFNVLGRLPEQAIVYPGHGAGSLCGKALRDEPTSTLRREFASSPALQIRNQDEFVGYMLSEQPRVPTNFARLAKLNRAGAPLAKPFIAREMSPAEVAAALNDSGTLVIDTRTQEEFSDGYIPGSVFLGFDSGMPTWLGWLFEPEQKFVLIVDSQKKAQEYATWMARIGYDNVVGYLPNGIKDWLKEGREIEKIDVITAGSAASQKEIIDVRTPREYSHGSLQSARNVPLCELIDRKSEISPEKPVILMCLGGYRGTVAASLLRRMGYEKVQNVEGGYAAVTSEAIGATP